MANIIQIKRSLTNATPTSLANGEFAFTANGDILYIGSNSETFAIGGRRNPGTLTANQALVANGSSYIDEIKTVNLYTTTISANGAVGTDSQILLSNSSGGIYWVNQSALNVNIASSSNTTNSALYANNATYLNTHAEADLNVNSALYANISVNISGGNAALIPFQSATNTTAFSNNLSYVDASNTLYVPIITVGNTTVNASISSNATITFFSGTANDTLNVGGSSATNYVQYNDSRDLTGNLVFNGANTVVNGSFLNISSNVNYTGKISSNFIPSITNNYDLGGDSYRWRNVYVGTGLQINTVSMSDNAGALAVNNLIVYANTIINNISGTTTYVSSNLDISSNTIYANSAVISVYAANIAHDVHIGGDLFVSGNVTSVNVATINVTDSMIYLAANNDTTDLVDIGFIGQYSNGTSNLYAGVFRDYVHKEFYTFQDWVSDNYVNNALIDTGNTGFQLSTLNTYLRSNALVSNSTSVYITANSTVNANFQANTLTLSSPLLGNSGGTGLNSYTNNDLLIANSTNGFDVLPFNANNGYILQSNGTAIVYASLDGGTF